MYLDSYIVRAIFAAKDGDLLKSVDFTKKICLLPLHQGSFVKGHWTLVIINLEKKTFAFYDSGTAVRNRGNVEKFFFEKFGSFLAICGSKVLGTIKNWSLIPSGRYPQQKDTFNCGIFIVKFCEQFIKFGSIEPLIFNPAEYRTFLKSYVLETSDDLSTISVCRKCYKSETSNSEQWVQCVMPHCQAWYHCKCINLDYYTMTQTGIIFKCSICE